MDYVRGKLLEKRQRLLQQMQSGVSATLEASRNPFDAADLANFQVAQDTGYEVGSLESRTVAEIDHVLDRLERGQYGVCEDCNRRIPLARLRAVPFASLCVRCKEREEQGESVEDPFAVSWDPLTELQGGGGDGEEEERYAVESL